MNEVSLIGYHGTDFANTHTILSDNYQISEGDTHWLGDGVYFFVESVLTNAEKANERVNKIELRTCNCTICSVYNPQKNIKFNKIIKKGIIR